MESRTLYPFARGARLICAAAITVALLLLPFGLRVAHADPNGNAHYNFMSGGGTATNNFDGLFGTTSPGDFKFAISAHCQAQGPVMCSAVDPLEPQPTGHVKLTVDYSPGNSVSYQGPVTCLDVQGNQGNLIFMDDTTGQYIEISATDNSTSAQQGPPSTLFANLVSNPYVCDLPITTVTTDASIAGAGGFIVKGNIVVNMGALVACTPMTDNTTYMIDSSCNLYVMTPSGWQVVE